MASDLDMTLLGVSILHWDDADQAELLYSEYNDYWSIAETSSDYEARYVAVLTVSRLSVFQFVISTDFEVTLQDRVAHFEINPTVQGQYFDIT